MLPQEIIRKKRDKKTLTKEEIDFFIKGVTSKEISDSQIGSFTMAVFLNGLNREEVKNLTLAMRNSGDVLKWKESPIIDKHSSGGVGDKVSLMLAPMLASCGAHVPMIAGKGLGCAGGTIDKLDSIPGYNTMADNKLFTKTVKEIGCAIIGQTGNLAPADKKIYSVRDVSTTVESISLITASILSKKLAEGLSHLVIDLKYGNGAYMESLDDARKLAKSIVQIAKLAGTKTTAIITDMNQVLGKTVGNALEVVEAIEYLQCKNVDSRLHEITIELCAELLVSSKLYKDAEKAKVALNKNLEKGLALKKFSDMVTALGGPKDLVKNYEKHLPKTKLVKPLFAKTNGYVHSMQTREVGLSLIGLKGGRTHPDQKIDYATGFSQFCQIGDKIDSKTPLCYIHAQSEDDYQRASQELLAAIKISKSKPKTTPCIIEKVK